MKSRDAVEGVTSVRDKCVLLRSEALLAYAGEAALRPEALTARRVRVVVGTDRRDAEMLVPGVGYEMAT